MLSVMSSLSQRSQKSYWWGEELACLKSKRFWWSTWEGKKYIFWLFVVFGQQAKGCESTMLPSVDICKLGLVQLYTSECKTEVSVISLEIHILRVLLQHAPITSLIVSNLQKLYLTLHGCHGNADMFSWWWTVKKNLFWVCSRKWESNLLYLPPGSKLCTIASSAVRSCLHLQQEPAVSLVVKT